MKKMAILIIDDHPVVLNGTKAILAPHFDVVTLEGSQQVVSNVQHILAGNEIELCLIDVQMPEISGIELCRMIRASSKSIKLILYTGYDVNDYAELLVNLEVDGIISKTASK